MCDDSYSLAVSLALIFECQRDLVGILFFPFLTKPHVLLALMHRLPPYLCVRNWCPSNTPMSRFTFSPNSFILSSYDLFIPISPHASAIYILYCFLHTYLRGCFQDEMTNINLGSSFTFIFSQRNYKKHDVLYKINLMYQKQIFHHI